MNRELLVLYQGKDGQTWLLFAGGETEAAHEFDLMSKEDDTLEEVAKFWINKTADIIFYGI